MPSLDWETDYKATSTKRHDLLTTEFRCCCLLAWEEFCGWLLRVSAGPLDYNKREDGDNWSIHVELLGAAAYHRVSLGRILWVAATSISRTVSLQQERRR